MVFKWMTEVVWDCDIDSIVEDVRAWSSKHPEASDKDIYTAMYNIVNHHAGYQDDVIYYTLGMEEINKIIEKVCEIIDSGEEYAEEEREWTKSCNSRISQ